MSDKRYTIIMRIIVAILVVYFLFQNPDINLNFGGKNKEQANNVDTGELVADRTSEILPSELPEMIKNSTLFKEDFILLLEGYKEAWQNKNLSVETYNQVSKNEKVMEALNWLMLKREGSLEVPSELSNAVREYTNEYQEQDIAQVFSDNDLLSLVREYNGNEWIVNLKYIPVSNASIASNSEKQDDNRIEFKVVELD